MACYDIPRYDGMDIGVGCDAGHFLVSQKYLTNLLVQDIWILVLSSVLKNG